MARPDRAELLAIARRPRQIGFVLVLAGATLFFLPIFDARLWYLGPIPSRTTAWVLICAGWTLFGYVVGRRTSHAIARRSEPDT